MQPDNMEIRRGRIFTSNLDSSCLRCSGVILLIVSMVCAVSLQRSSCEEASITNNRVAILRSVPDGLQKETPLDRAELLSKATGNNIWLKREDLQPVFSFKLRGAFNKMASLPKKALAKGVICSSAGNHAQGVALAAQRLGTSSVICMPINTPTIKVLHH